MSKLTALLDSMSEWAAFGGLLAADVIYVGVVWLDMTVGHGETWLFLLERYVEGPLLLLATVWVYWAIRRRD